MATADQFSRDVACLDHPTGPEVVDLAHDDTDDGRRPVHTALLGAGVPIVEHLCNLAALPTEA